MENENELPAWVLIAVYLVPWAIIIAMFYLLPASVFFGILAVILAFIWPKKGR